MTGELFLIAVALISSAVTATIGMGGGILLIAVMPGFVPPPALVPLHGVTQLGSNLSRTLTNRAHVDWALVLPYAGGALLGGAAGAPLARRMPVDWIPLVLGVFILLAVWLPRPGAVQVSPAGGARWWLLGAVQTAVSLFVGAAGPLSGPLLLRRGLERDALVATHASFMTVMHGVKVVAFGVLGFAFAPYAALLVGMVLAVFVGTALGNRLRARVPEQRFRMLFRWVVTLLAVRMLVGFAI